MPKVSIITASYNHENYIAEAIESVIAQTYQDWEYLIWDDGSSDRTREIAEQYQKRFPEKIKVFTHPKKSNQGQENTRNAALEKSSGDLLCLLDSDDFYLPRKLELLVPAFENHHVGLAYGKANFYSQKSKKMLSSGIRSNPSGDVFGQLVYDNFVCAGATLFRRSCIEKGIRFDPSFKTIGEYPLWLKIARDWKFAHIPEVVSVWRDHGANLGTRLALQGKHELVNLCEQMLENPTYVDQWPVIRKALVKKRYDYASELYENLMLDEVRSECQFILKEELATQDQKVKAAILSTLTTLGKKPNALLSKAKKRFWSWRRSWF